MTGREWKPGDVALVTIDGKERPVVRSEGGHKWIVEPEPSSRRVIESVRPLVVIDPEDRQQVAQLVKMFNHTDGPVLGAVFTDRLQAALREFANPTPKPAEPTGLGAVIEDAEGKRWTRYDERDPQPWWRTGTGDPDEPIECRFAYADISAVRVLSEGVAS